MKAPSILVLMLSFFLISCDGGNSSGGKSIYTPINAADFEKSGSSKAKPTAVEKAPDPAAPTAVAEAPKSVDGKTIYNRSCASCHNTGAAGAPKVGDTNAWASRIAKGTDALIQSAIKGVPGTAMMPKGTCAACSDDELKATVEYMVSQSK